MRYINENYRGMPLFKDGDLEVCATKYDQEPFAWVHLALLVFYTRKLGCLMMEHCSIIELF
uniref:Uncharacterized protein n=1 Tax=Meloidogyne enterolobii TaxID=390850 RepID=A0A6V7Y436_MELEN|nr:unnamed protein product [Meloidogyne enterolobii]